MLVRPTAEPLSRRRAIVDHVRRLDPRRVLTRLVVGISLLVVLDVGAGWKQTIDGLGTTSTVATMRRDVPAGMALTAADVEMSSWPTVLVPAAAYVEDPVGQIARTDLVTGEVLVGPRLFPNADGLEADERLVTLPAPLAPPPLSPGTRVELFGIRSFGDGLMTPSTRLVSGVVIHVDDQSIAVAVRSSAVPVVLEHIAFGVVDVVIEP